MPKVSIITPAHIDSKQKMLWFVEAIQSVLDQTESDWEMIIVNNCSTDDLEIKNLLLPVWGDERIKSHKYEREPNVSIARNIAAHNATSGLLLPLDADDKLPRDAIEKFLHAWELGGKEQGIVYSDVLMFGDNGHRYVNAPDYNFNSLLRRLFMPIGCLHRKSDWERVGGWLVEMKSGLEDWEYWIRMGENGVCGYHVSEPLYHYRRHAYSRYTTLCQDGRSGFNQAQLKMRELHKDVYNGRFPMSCCLGGGISQAVRPQMQQAQSVPQSLQNPEKILYVGRRKGSFYVTGRATGIKYRIPGKDKLLVALFGQTGVDERDVVHILTLNRGHDFKREVQT